MDPFQLWKGLLDRYFEAVDVREVVELIGEIRGNDVSVYASKKNNESGKF